MIQHIHNKTTWNKKLFVGKLNNRYQCHLSEEGAVHYAINSILYMNTLRESHIKVYEKFINQLKMYTNTIRVLSMGYLPISLLPQLKLKEILNEVKKTIEITNLDYDIIIKGLYLYYDMKLVTFSINEERNLIVQFPIFIQPCIQQIILYQIEMVPVPIIDLNKKTPGIKNVQKYWL